MNDRLYSILTGMIYGDGCLHINVKRNNYVTLIIKHGEKQEDYLKFKAKLLSSILDSEIKVRAIQNNGYKAFTFSKGHTAFQGLRKTFYPNGVKTFTKDNLDRLTPEGIAIWYMDDGSLAAKKRNGKIHAHEMSLSTYTTFEQNEIIIDYFKTYGIILTQRKNKNHFTLRGGTGSAKTLSNLIREFVHPSMKYKLL